MTLEEEISSRIGEVRTDTLDMSFGEIANLHKNRELVIQPEYQRLFRWSEQQKSHLIESILLELPIPQIFVIENPDDIQTRNGTIIFFKDPDGSRCYVEVAASTLSGRVSAASG